jgi:hypothetical protein
MASKKPNATFGASKKLAKKKAPAPTGLLKDVAKLLDLATKAPAPTQLQVMTTDKLYEVLVLSWMLLRFKGASRFNSVVHVPPTGAKTLDVVFALSPARADRGKFSHFDLREWDGEPYAEGWISVEVETLSWSTSPGSTPGLSPPAGHHELDVCVLRPGAPAFPSYDDVYAAASCKNTGGVAKDHVREAMGLRRETAYLQQAKDSLAPWLAPSVPADPPSPLFLVCSDAKVKDYRQPIDALGVYARHMRMPT